MKTGNLGMQTFAQCLEVVAELVQQDQQHDPDRVPPAEEERVQADGDEDAARLGDHERELRQRDRAGDQRPERALDRLAPVSSLRPQRLVVGVLAHDPCPIHSSPPA